MEILLKFDYTWIMKYDIYDLILLKRSLNFTSPHIVCLTIGPKKKFKWKF